MLKSSILNLVSNVINMVTRSTSQNNDSTPEQVAIPACPFDHLRSVKHFYPTYYDTPQAFVKMYNEVCHVLTSLRIKQLLLNAPFDDISTKFSNELDVIAEVGGKLYLHPESKLQSTEGVKITKVFAKKFEYFDEDAVVAETNIEGVTVRSHSLSLNDETSYKLIVFGGYDWPGLNAKNFKLRLKLFKEQSQEERNADIENLARRIDQFALASCDPILYFRAFKGEFKNSLDQYMLQLIDVSLRVEAHKQACRYENLRLQRAVFWTVYKAMWRTLFPQGTLKTPDELPAYQVLPEFTLITGISTLPYSRRRENEKLDGDHFNSGPVTCLFSKDEDYIVLGPFARDPLTWPTKGSANTIKTMHPVEWHSAILLMHPGQPFKLTKSPKIEKYLVRTDEYNQMVRRWEVAFVESYRRLPKQVLRNSVVQKDNQFFVDSPLFGLKWLLTGPNMIYRDYSLIYEMPVCLVSFAPKSSTFIPTKFMYLMKVPSRKTVNDADFSDKKLSISPHSDVLILTTATF